jgi:hypothetical protein
MLWYFSQPSCCFARHWFPTTPSPGAVVAALEAEVVASMVAGACMAAVDATLREVLARAIRLRGVLAGPAVPSQVALVTVAQVTRVAR